MKEKNKLLLIKSIGMVCLIFFLLMTLSSLLVWAKTKVTIKYPEPKEIAKGRINEISFIAKGISKIDSIEITPSQGVSVSEIRKVNAIGLKKGITVWNVLFSVEENAELGMRSIVVVATEGRSKPQQLTIVNETPRISKLRIRSSKGLGGEAEFSFIVLDEILNPNMKLKIKVDYPLGSGRYVAAKVIKIEPEGEKNSKVYAKVGGAYGVKYSGPFDLGVSIQLKGHNSNRLIRSLRF